MIAAGDVVTNGIPRMAVARFKSGGPHAPAFAGNGGPVFQQGANRTGRAVAMQADGRVLIAGSIDTGDLEQFLTVRLLTQ